MTTTHPLGPMTAALQALLEQQRALDQREVEEAAEHFPTAAPRTMNLEAIDHLERAIACVPADTSRDAVIQVLIATGRAQGLEQDTFERPSADELAVVLQLLRLAVPVLARDNGVDLEAFGASHYGLWRQPGRSTRQSSSGGPEPSEADESTRGAQGRDGDEAS